MLEIQNIYKTFNAGTVNEKHALNGVSLKLEDGDFVTVIGGNGAGKSTTLNAIAGVWPVDEGKIIIDGVDVTKLSEHKRAKYLEDEMLACAQISADLDMRMQNVRDVIAENTTPDERPLLLKELS